MNKLKPIIDPIILSTTFVHEVSGGNGYSRIDNPTRLDLEKKLAHLEKARFGLAFSSGSSAVFTVLALLKKGEHIICDQQVYEGTLRLLKIITNNFGIEFSLADLTDAKNVNKKLKNNTKMVLIESITNPKLNVINVKKISNLLKKRRIILAVDNTIATPISIQPLLQGADIVIHSLTKFISGHHDVTAGAVMTNNKKLFKKLEFLQQMIGCIPSPFDCFLIRRGIETLTFRMRVHQANALVVSNFLKHSKNIENILFPGMSGLISFNIKGNKNKTTVFLKKLKKVKIAHSFGGTVTTIMHPQTMMNLSTPVGNLLRLSVGLENPPIIINDIDKALI